MNKLGIAIVEKCTKFAKSISKPKVLPKSVHVSNSTGLRYTSSLTKDVVQLKRQVPSGFFSSLERNIINEIKCGKIENARVIACRLGILAQQ